MGKPVSHKREVKKLDDLWSEYIRKRAMNLVHGCQASPILHLPICTGYRHSWKDIQAAHCFGRTSFTTRWDILNGCGICGHCHQYIDTHEDAKFELFRALIGNSKDFEMLYFRSKLTTKQMPIDFKLTEIYLKTLIKQLDGVVATTS